MKSSNSPLYRHFIKGLQAQRKAQGLSQVGLAARIDAGQSAVSKIERVERRIDIAEFVEIARAIGSDPVKLFARLLASYSRSEVPMLRRKSLQRRRR